MTANNTKGTSTADLIREMMTGDDGQKFTASFLRGKFLLSAVDSLARARKAARLTQAAVARALGTKQPAIARMEQDTEGSMSLKRLYDYAAACDTIPLITLAPASQVAEFTYEHPDEPLTADSYMSWKQAREQHADIWRRSFTHHIHDNVQTFVVNFRYSGDLTCEVLNSRRGTTTLTPAQHAGALAELRSQMIQPNTARAGDASLSSTLTSESPGSPVRQLALSY